MLPSLLIALLGATALISSAAAVCPNVPKAKRHYNLVVSNMNVPLPGGKILPGLVFNNSYIGPAIYATLGETISIDVFNNASVGECASLKLLDISESQVIMLVAYLSMLQVHLSTGMVRIFPMLHGLMA